MSTRLPDGPTSQGTLARMSIDELIGRHCREYRLPTDDLIAVKTLDGEWAVWRRESDRKHAVRVGSLAHPDDAVRVARQP